MRTAARVFEHATVGLFVWMTATVTYSQEPGLVNAVSKFSVAETIDKIESTARARGLMIFGRIDHSGEAKKAGFEMRPTQLLILGNPKTGTPVMQSAPSSAIDLPLKVLVWQEPGGSTVVTVNDPRWLAARHKVPDDVAKPLAGLTALIDAALK